MRANVYQEPNKLPAGILTLAVHGAFFALLYLGFTWQAQPPATMQVELWDSLPEIAPEEAVTPPPTPRIEEVAPPPQPRVIAPEIALPDKKKPKPVEKAPEKKQPEPKPVATKPVEVTIQKPDTSIADRQAAQEQADRAKAAEQAGREQAEKAAAQGRVVDEYKAKIMAKIRRNIVMPANVLDDARAEFSVTLLPGGAVLQAKLLKSSGNASYDNAVERAILKSEPLPLPPDVALFNKFRELKLVFKPTE